MALQHRRYRLKPGALDAFVRVWAEQVVPLRRRFGFDVEGAWSSPEADCFVWVVSHPGGRDEFARAERAYYDSPQRSAISPNPGDLIDDAEVTMLEAVERPTPGESAPSL